MTGARPLRIRGFRDLLVAQLVSLFGDHVYFLVFLFMAKEVSDGNWQVGLVMAAQAVPFLVFWPLAGIAADRIDRRKIMAFADFASAGLTASLAGIAVFHPQPPIWVIGAFAFLLSSVNAFFMPARMAGLPRLVPQELLGEANALFITMQQMVGMVSIAVSAVVLGVIFELAPSVFLLTAAILNSVTFLFSGYWVLRLPEMAPARDSEGDKEPHGWGEFKEGVRTVFKDKVLRIILPANMLAQMFISGFMVVYVEVNKVWFGGSYYTFAWIEFSFAASMAAMGLYVGRLKIGRPGLSFSLATAAVGLTVLMMAWAQNFWLFVFWNALAGFAVPFAWLPIQVYIQSAFKDKVRGKVSSAWMSSQMGVQPVGLLSVGPLLDWLGLNGIFLLMGGGMAAAGFLGLLSKACRDGRMPEPADEPHAA
ncbi:MAG: MFS transporter [Armatimonadetes bacterium]|nr:MFS transporter [Armatimonadota bacterium]